MHWECSIILLCAHFDLQNGVQKQKGRLMFRQIEIFHVFQIVSSLG